MPQCQHASIPLHASVVQCLHASMPPYLSVHGYMPQCLYASMHSWLLASMPTCLHTSPYLHSCPCIHCSMPRYLSVHPWLHVTKSLRLNAFIFTAIVRSGPRRIWVNSSSTLFSCEFVSRRGNVRLSSFFTDFQTLLRNVRLSASLSLTTRLQ